MAYESMSTVYERDIDNALLGNETVADAFGKCMPEIKALFDGE